MKIMKKPKRLRIRMDGKALFGFGEFNYSLFQAGETRKKNYHHTLSYSFDRKDFDIHITRENPKRNFSLLKFDFAALDRITDNFIQQAAEYIRDNVMTMNVSPGLERDGLFQFSIPKGKPVKEMMQKYGEIFTEHKSGEINIITEDDALLKKARKSGKFNQFMESVEQIQREGFKMRLWNFRSAIVEYKSLHLLILSYDKDLRLMKCLDLNKIMNGGIFTLMINNALGVGVWEQIQDTFAVASQAVDNGNLDQVREDPIWLR
ncbi:MAG: hypothetical protein ACOY5B_18780 [Spirochaetota bacterium]